MDKLNLASNTIDFSIVPGQSQPLLIQLHSYDPAPKVHNCNWHSRLACAWQLSSWDAAAMSLQQVLY